MYYQVVDDTLWIGSTNWEGATSGDSITNNSIINVKCKNILKGVRTKLTITSSSCLNCELVADTFGQFRDGSYDTFLEFKCPALQSVSFGDSFSGNVAFYGGMFRSLEFPFNPDHLALHVVNNNSVNSINGLNGKVILRLENCIALTNLDLTNCTIMNSYSYDNNINKCHSLVSLNINYSSKGKANYLTISDCNNLEEITVNSYIKEDTYAREYDFNIKNLNRLTTLKGSVFKDKVPSNFTGCPNLTNIISDGSVEGRDSYTVSIYHDNNKGYLINSFVDNGVYTVANGTLFHIKGERCLYCEMAGALIVDSKGVMNYKQGNDIRFPVNDNLTVYIIPTDDKVNLNTVIKAVANPQ